MVPRLHTRDVRRVQPSIASLFEGSFWDWLLVQQDFIKSISRHGYYRLERMSVHSAYNGWRRGGKASFQSHSGKRLSASFPSNAPRHGNGIPASFSTDYYSRTPYSLKSNGLYVVPVGSGDCLIFDEKVFPRPYLKLHGLYSDAKKLAATTVRGFDSIIEALSFQWNEQSFLRALHFCGGLGGVVKKMFGTASYHSGPSGAIRSSFPFWMKDIRRNKLVRFIFDGMADLDECLYVKHLDVVIPIEVKIDYDHEDLGWHKLAFPCYRFIDNSRAFADYRQGSSQGTCPSFVKRTSIFPMYCAYSPPTQSALIYVFPEVKASCFSTDYGKKFVEKGIILNNPKHLEPERVFEVDMKWTGL